MNVERSMGHALTEPFAWTKLKYYRVHVLEFKKPPMSLSEELQMHKVDVVPGNK